MPFTIQTVEYAGGSPMPSGETRRAVLTIEEAREHAYAEVMRLDDHNLYAKDLALALTVAGGTIGPLADANGCILIVGMVPWQYVIEDAGGGFPQLPVTDEEKAEIIDAYNEAQR